MYSKWKQRAGGYKLCPMCLHRHSAVMRIGGRLRRPKTCVKCGTALPRKLSYPKKAAARWYVREFDPVTGRSQDRACRSSEDADELIRRKERDFTRDPIQERLIEHASVLIRQIQADAFDDAVNALITKLGGDPLARTLKPIGLAEAIDRICDELRHKERASDVYIEEARRVAQDFIAISGLESWADADAEAVKAFASALAVGGWQREDRRVRPLGSHTIKKALATLRAFVTRAVQNGWIHPRVIHGESDAGIWSQVVDAVEHPYLPDADFMRLIETVGGDRWMKTLILLAYNTAARRGDLLRLTWADVDLDGQREESGTVGPTVRIANTKGNRRRKVKKPLFIPLDEHVLETLQDLRASPVAVVHPHTPIADRAVRVDEDGRAVDDEAVFPIRGYRRPACEVSEAFAELCVRAGLTDKNGKNRWTLHDLRRKANMDIQRAGASLREAMSLTGHATPQVNIANYQSPADLARLRDLTRGMSGFKALRIVRESA